MSRVHCKTDDVSFVAHPSMEYPAVRSFIQGVRLKLWNINPTPVWWKSRARIKADHVYQVEYVSWARRVLVVVFFMLGVHTKSSQCTLEFQSPTQSIRGIALSIQCNTNPLATEGAGSGNRTRKGSGHDAFLVLPLQGKPIFDERRYSKTKKAFPSTTTCLATP